MSADPSNDNDRQWMRRALHLAEQGLGQVEPNPLVGCVLVRKERLVGSGYHAEYGGPHAELAAVQDAMQAGRADLLRGCTAYVTLEPCCHHGKTPPCCDLLIEAGVSRVVIAMQDPFPAVSGKGIQQLKEAGIQVDTGLLEHLALQLNAPYIKRIQSGRPWVIAKWAMSLDGRIATATGHSQWISCETSREAVHRLRGRVDAILVGSRTAAADDPMLTARLSDGQPPLRVATRVIVDSQLNLRPESRIVQTAQKIPTLVWCGPGFDQVKASRLRQLGCQVESPSQQSERDRLDHLLLFLADQYQATNVLVEGGGGLLGALFDLKQIDECQVFIAPKIIGGQLATSPIAGLGINKVTDGPRCISLSTSSSGDDIHWCCRLDWSGTGAEVITQTRS